MGLRCFQLFILYDLLICTSSYISHHKRLELVKNIRFFFDLTIENGEELHIRLCFVFFFFFFNFLFFTQNQVPQEVTGLDRVIYHIKALSVAIRTTFNLKKNQFPNVEKYLFTLAKQSVKVRTFFFFQRKSQILLRLSRNYCCDLIQQ